MNCPKCNRENAEIFSGLINGESVPDALANFCKRCGTDLRPFHAEIMKTSHLRPIRVSDGFFRHSGGNAQDLK